MSEQSFIKGHKKRHTNKWSRLAHGLYASLEHSHYAEISARQIGLLQGIDARVKLICSLACIITAVSSHSLVIVYGLCAASAVLAKASCIPLTTRMRWVWLNVLVFTGTLAIPALFMVPGKSLYQLPWLGWHISLPGLQSAAFLIGRALASASFMALLVLTTPWPLVLKALGTLHVPAVAIVILGMTYRYIFVLVKTANELMLARQSRVFSHSDRAMQRRMIVSQLGVLFAKSYALSQDIYLAMLARGYRGKDMLMHDFHLRYRDWITLLIVGTFIVMTLTTRLVL